MGKQAPQRCSINLDLGKFADSQTLAHAADQQTALRARGKGVFRAFARAVNQHTQTFAKICGLPPFNGFILRFQKPLKTVLFFLL